MSIKIGREAVVNNTLKNNLRPLPQLDAEPFIEIADKATVFVLDGPVTVKHEPLDIPFWVVRILAGSDKHHKDRVGWMAEINQSGKTILVGS